jgi:hypothetical protein
MLCQGAIQSDANKMQAIAIMAGATDVRPNLAV